MTGDLKLVKEMLQAIEKLRGLHQANVAVQIHPKYERYLDGPASNCPTHHVLRQPNFTVQVNPTQFSQDFRVSL